MIHYLKSCGLFYLVNGLVMLIVPALWYQLTPGVLDTGPFNAHFIRDVGIAFIISGAGLWYALSSRDEPNLPLAWLACGFLVGHSLLHTIEMFAYSTALPVVARDFTLIVLPILVAVIGLMRLGPVSKGRVVSAKT